MSTTTSKNDPKIIKAWSMYDWANSAYNLVITTTIFPVYYKAVTDRISGQSDGFVDFFGMNVKSSSLINYVLAFSYLIIAFFSPILSSIADSKGNKKVWMKFFTYLGGASCCFLFFFTDYTLATSMVLFGLAAIGFTGSLVFYNSYLPEIATIDKQDAVSAKGYAYGYLGSVLLQIVCLILVMYPTKFGLGDGEIAARTSFLLTGIWWLGFAQIPFSVLPKGSPNYVASEAKHSPFAELSKVLAKVKQMPALKTFLGAYFFYIMGVNTIMLVAAIFGANEIDGMTAKDLILTILLIQIVAIFGARIMAGMSEKMGNVKVLMVAVILWIFVCLFGYTVTSKIGFYGLAIMVGLVMGGVQSLSRSTYSKLLPPNTVDTAAFFSFFDITEKIAIVLGMALFATVGQLYHMRYSALALVIPFSMGLITLFIMWFKYPQSRLLTTNSTHHSAH